MENKLEKYGQQHLLRFENQLSKKEKEALYKQIESLDFSYLQVKEEDGKSDLKTVSPIKGMEIAESEKRHDEFEKIGLKVLENQQLAAVLLAGGMGTRLGSDKPKGVFNIGKTRDVYIFQTHFETLLKAVEKCGKWIPFFIMTSEKNHEVTVEFLRDHNYFGYNKDYVCFYMQEMAPCVDFNGKILLEEKGKVATSPNGNGGWFSSLLKDDKAREMLEKHDIKWINMFGVDNVLQGIADPVFLGAVIDGGYEIGAKVVKKTVDTEKVGLFCKKNGRPSMIDYGDMTEEMTKQRDETGDLVYKYGNVLNYLFDIDLLYKFKDQRLPVHIVTKKVPYIDENGNLVNPDQPNAHKFELFSLDLFEYAKDCLPFVVEREKEFAPIKNKEGADSVATAQTLLEKNGYKL